MVGDEAQHRKGGSAENTHPRKGFYPEIRAQDKIKAHSYAAGQNRKDKLPHTQTEKHGFGIVADFTVDFDFQ